MTQSERSDRMCESPGSLGTEGRSPALASDVQEGGPHQTSHSDACIELLMVRNMHEEADAAALHALGSALRKLRDVVYDTGIDATRVIEWIEEAQRIIEMVQPSDYEKAIR